MQPKKVFLKFKLCTQALLIGERIKGGTFRPCVETIPSSTLEGAFRHQFGMYGVKAVGFLNENSYKKAVFTYAPFDTALKTAKLPISAEYLIPNREKSFSEIEGDVYILKDDTTESLSKNEKLHISLGAFKSKGFGECVLEFDGELNSGEPEIGYLKGRIFERDIEAFGITRVIKRCFGYLFEPTIDGAKPAFPITGAYKPALFKKSVIEGPRFLLNDKKEYPYDIG